MNLLDMMRAASDKKDPISCPVLVLLRGLVFEGFARSLSSAWAARALACGVNRSRAWCSQ